jgi:signal transduction histidine kinase
MLEVESLFEPFRRQRRERTAVAPGSDSAAGAPRGAGIGLSIVRAVATVHGGTVTAAPRPAGGLDIAVTLPAPPR